MKAGKDGKLAGQSKPRQYSGRSSSRWLETILYVPTLYGIGWVIARPLAFVAPSLRLDQVNLLGAVISLMLLLLTLPLRLRRAWRETMPWRTLGVMARPLAILRAFLGGLLKAILLLALEAGILLLVGNAQWRGLAPLEVGEMLNAVTLMVGVGFAEELVFRGWLWEELQHLMAPQIALLVQAGIFALVHPWSQNGWQGAVGLLVGLILLGLNLALQRRADGGVIWGAVGLHGGLVGGWFALQAGLLELSATTPTWLVGPGGSQPNPIGGVIAYTGLGLLLLARRRYWRVGMQEPSC